MNHKGMAITKREGRLYVRSPLVWMAALVIGAASLALIPFQSRVPPDLLLTRGEYVAVPVTLLVAALVFTAGLAREEREQFEDLWNTLPVRNTTQYWSKLLGTWPAGVIFVAFLLLIIPSVWYFQRLDWTQSANLAALLHLAQGVGVVLLAAGLSAFLRSVIPSFRLRGVVGVGLIVFIVLSPRLIGMPWGVLLAPHVVGSIPWGFSALFGASPWEPGIMWHVAFEISLAITLITAASVVYKRHREPGTWLGFHTLLLIVFLSLTVVSAYQYNVFWQQIRGSEAAEAEHDAATQVAGRGWRAPTVSAYDIVVQWANEGSLSIRTHLQFQPQPAGGRTPFTLHHQWEVVSVDGEGVVGWERDGNLLWVTVDEGRDRVDLTVDYHGAPFVWEYSSYIAVPAQFMLPSGGYLSPHMAWYPLPGARVLHSPDPPVSSRPRIGSEPLLTQPAAFRLTWHGTADMEVVTSLPESPQAAAGVRLFTGHSDGVALFAVRSEQGTPQTDAVFGAPSLVRRAEPLLTLYGILLDFYSALLERRIELDDRIVLVPSWLENAYGMHIGRRTPGVEGRGFLVMPLLGDRLVLTERHTTQVLGSAAEWRRTGDPGMLLEASGPLHDALQQSLWGGVHSHLAFLRSPVVEGIAEFARLQWVRHVLGEGAYHDALAAVAVRMTQPRTSASRISDEVVQSLMHLEQTKGMAAVRQVFGWTYDQLKHGDLDLDTVVRFIESVQ